MRGASSAAVFLAFVAAFAADFTLTYDWHLNELLEELELRGDVSILRGYGPYFVSDVLSAAQAFPDAFWSARAARLCSPFSQKAPFFLWTPGVWGDRRSWSDYTRSFGRMRLGFGGTRGGWSVVGIYRLDSGYYADPNYFGARWERVAGKADQVFIRWGGEDYFLQLGRDYFRFGLGMALSGRKPYERLLAGFRLGKRGQLVWSIGQLDEYVEFVDTTKIIYNRYLAYHRFELTFPWLQLAFNEMMLFGGVGRQVELYYLLPLYAFHGEQLNHKWDDNTLWSVDAKILLPPFRLRFEGVLDDYQIEHETPADREPPEYGFAVEADWALSSSRAFLTLWSRYEQVRNRTFNQIRPWNRYLYENKPLGPEYGNDYDQTSVGLRLLGAFYGGEAKLYYRRKGEGRIDDPWTEPWIDDPDWSEPFPSGVVEGRLGIDISLWADGLSWDLGRFSGQLAAGIAWRWEHITNANHQKGSLKDEWTIRFELESRFWGKL